jgi:hypothetical protein
VGTPDEARFSLNGDNALILEEPAHVQVGESAVEQARFIKRREDRHWVESDEWHTLFLAMLTELTTAPFDRGVRVVTGLPVSFYADRAAVRDRLLGEHRVTRKDRHPQTFQVVECKVIPQPFGALCAVCLDDRGRIVDQDIASGAVGVVDCGGKTTNLLSVNRLKEIGRETASVNTGAWDAMRAMRAWLDAKCPDLELRDHQVINVLITRTLKYKGHPVEIEPVIDEILEPLAAEVVAAASQLWNGAAGLEAILLAGGGALLLGKYIKQHFHEHARVEVVENPVYSNALGFWKFCQRLARATG